MRIRRRVTVAYFSAPRRSRVSRYSQTRRLQLRRRSLARAPGDLTLRHTANHAITFEGPLQDAGSLSLRALSIAFLRCAWWILFLRVLRVPFLRF